MTGNAGPLGTGTSGGGRDYLEGDERVYTDGSLSPQMLGTGTEDFYQGGWYFRNHEFNDPLNGHPDEFLDSNGCPAWCDTAYRVMLTDSVDYDNSLRFGMQHGYTDDVPATYSTTAFLYTQPTSTLHRTDSIQVTDPGSDSAHNYSGGAATDSALYSQYEGADDSTPVQATTRSTSAPLSFSMAIDAANGGVLLRRTSDQDKGYQSAAVSVDGTPVGTWLEPRSNPDSRWLSDTFAIPASVSAGKSAITITITPSAGSPAWSASSYTVDSIVAPWTDTGSPPAPTDLAVLGTRHAIRFSWTEPLDDTAITSYQIYSSASANVAITTANLIGTSTTTGFVQDAVPSGSTRHYAVVAVGADGDASPASAVLSATGSKWLHSDVNGDGTDDVVTFTQGSPAPVYVALSANADSFVGNALMWDSDFGNAGQVTRTGDFNGDGKDDIIRFTRGTTGDAYVALSSGSGFGASSQWDSGFCLNDQIPLVGDFNGDGKDDVACVDPDNDVIWVALSDGHGFGPATEWIFPNQLLPPGPSSAPNWTGYVPVVGDFNGDGMSDIALIDNTGHRVAVALSRASYFSGTSWIWNSSFGNPGETPGAGDFNGDGMDDIVTFTPGHNVYVSLSNGTSFVQSGWNWNISFSGGSEVPGVGDFNGDGKSDVVTFTRGTDGSVYVSLSNGQSFVQTGWLWNSHFCVGNEWCQPSQLLTSSAP
jgi:hypothetical protein